VLDVINRTEIYDIAAYLAHSAHVEQRVFYREDVFDCAAIKY
jgi:hypothetical protein